MNKPSSKPKGDQPPPLTPEDEKVLAQVWKKVKLTAGKK